MSFANNIHICNRSSEKRLATLWLGPTKRSKICREDIKKEPSVIQVILRKGNMP